MSEALRITDPWLTDPVAQSVITMLTDSGHEAYFVGGCVRNALLDAPVADIDISTSARPEAVSNLAQKAGFKPVPTGIDHGTVTVVAKGQPFEITTYRKDVETDGRRAVVAYAERLEEDAQRRDFTMNALYADASGRVTDPVGGLPDLRARRMRFIGDAHARIREDALRILRFFRFHAWYGDPEGGIDAEGLAACADHLDMLDLLSRERVGHEMRKLLAAPDPAPALASFAATGGLARILPGASSEALTLFAGSPGDTPPDPITRLAAMGGENVVDRLRLSKAEAGRLTLLRSEMGGAAGPGELGYRHGAEAAKTILHLRLYAQGQVPDADDLAKADKGAAARFPLTARDLMPALDGPALGKALKTAERRWIDSGFTLSKEELLG